MDLLHDDSPDEAALRRQFDAEISTIRGPGYNALGVEMGYRYRDGALVPDGTPEPVAADPETDYLARRPPAARTARAGS